MSLIGLIASSWGSQFYITCIEAIIFLIALIIITIVEFKTGKLYGYNKIVDPGESFMNVHSIPVDRDEMENRMRAEALKRIKHYSYWNDFFKGKYMDEDQRDHIHERFSQPDRIR